MTDDTVAVTADQAMHIAMDLKGQGKRKEAEIVMRGVLDIEPEHFSALNHLAALLAEDKKYYEALYRVDRALKVRKRDKYAISNRGMILGQLGHLEESETEFRRSIHQDESDPVLWNNLGNTLERMGRYSEALPALNRTLELDPQRAISYMNRGIVKMKLFRQHEAIEDLDKAIALNPDIGEAYYNRGIAKLALGDFAGGWPDYEYRLDIAEGSYYVGPFDQPKWEGHQALEGKTILLHAEQGLGDSIQFMRFVPLVLDLGIRHIFMVAHTPLRILTSTDRVTVLKAGEAYPPFDYWCPLMSLPLAFGTTEGTIPPPWDIRKDQMPERGRRLRVGVCWAGSENHKNDAHRSIPLKQFSVLLHTKDIDFFSLQRDIRHSDVADCSELKHVTVPPMDSVEATAKAIAMLDLVITVDTSIAHLAGTLDTPTWILLPKQSTDWRWMLDREDTPWYPSAKLFRQTHVGDWESVLARVKRELAKEVADNVIWKPRYLPAQTHPAVW